MLVRHYFGRPAALQRAAIIAMADEHNVMQVLPRIKFTEALICVLRQTLGLARWARSPRLVKVAR